MYNTFNHLNINSYIELIITYVHVCTLIYKYNLTHNKLNF